VWRYSIDNSSISQTYAPSKIKVLKLGKTLAHCNDTVIRQLTTPTKVEKLHFVVPTVGQVPKATILDHSVGIQVKVFKLVHASFRNFTQTFLSKVRDPSYVEMLH
jgi:hypothetical protein